MNLCRSLTVICALVAGNAAFCVDKCGKPAECTVDSTPWVNPGPDPFAHPANLPGGRYRWIPNFQLADRIVWAQHNLNEDYFYVEDYGCAKLQLWESVLTNPMSPTSQFVDVFRNNSNIYSDPSDQPAISVLSCPVLKL